MVIELDTSVAFMLALLTVVASFLFLTSRLGRLPSSSVRILKRSVTPAFSIDDFLHSRVRESDAGRYYIFKEQMVYSTEHSFRGRFDQAVVRCEDKPVLEMVIERKFPTHSLPLNGRPEDFLQAGLYSLAFAERGVNCESARLLLMYCRQKDAQNCSRRSSLAKCATCPRGRLFQKRFRSHDVLRVLHRLDKVWTGERRARASPSHEKCVACAFGKNGYCEYSIA
jgi:hypothetical protein